ncbi:MAG: hypothetical protein H6715_05160 [Myxococcales bacterium]|nr:hypothetical protein [Myxococcales bacterium]MCB9709260.1 hypothetical protein [Myxococcales bacterium]
MLRLRLNLGPRLADFRHTQAVFVAACGLAAVACTADASANLVQAKEGQDARGQETAVPQWQRSAPEALRQTSDDYPVLLGDITSSTVEFTAERAHRWECETGDAPEARVIFVCKTEDEVRTRCYSIEPFSPVHDTDPYLSCVLDENSWRCAQSVLANGSYHVGALYESATCGQYAFWWKGVIVSGRNLSASLTPLTEPSRPLDHRMARVLETPAENHRWINVGTKVKLDLAILGEEQEVHGIFVETQGGVSQIRAGEQPCYGYSAGQRWWCPIGLGSGHHALVLEGLKDAGTLAVRAGLDGWYDDSNPEDRVMFTDIDVAWHVYLPVL